MSTKTAVLFPLTKLLFLSPRSSFRRDSKVRLSTNEIAAAACSMATLRWLAPWHSAGNEACVEGRQRMSAQDSTNRLLLSTRHPTTGTGSFVVRREPRGACTGTRAGSQLSVPSIFIIACSPARGLPFEKRKIMEEPFGEKLGARGRGHAVQQLGDLHLVERRKLVVLLCKHAARSVLERHWRRREEKNNGPLTAYRQVDFFAILFVTRLHERRLYWGRVRKVGG